MCVGHVTAQTSKGPGRGSNRATTRSRGNIVTHLLPYPYCISKSKQMEMHVVQFKSPSPYEELTNYRDLHRKRFLNNNAIGNYIYIITLYIWKTCPFS